MKEPYNLHLGDCLIALRALPDNSVAAAVNLVWMAWAIVLLAKGVA